MAEESQKKTCAQCGDVKLLATEFYRSKNGKDGHMKMCKACYAVNKEANAIQQQVVAERWRQEREEAMLLRLEEEKQAQIRKEQEEQRRREAEEYLVTWYMRQPPRICIACSTMKEATEFGHSSRVTDESGYWIPSSLHQRCKPCHELYRGKSWIPCILCGQPTEASKFMRSFDGYTLYGEGVRISICCRSCESAFRALPRVRQQFYIRARVHLLHPTPQVIYAEVDPRTQEIRYVGRTGRLKRRHSEHLHQVTEGPRRLARYNQETQQYTEMLWFARSSWMFELQQQGLQPLQRILLEVEPSAYVIEYERRFILHGLQQGWPLVNTEAMSGVKELQAISLDFLHAPFEDLVSANWFSKRGIEAFLREWYS